MSQSVSPHHPSLKHQYPPLAQLTTVCANIDDDDQIHPAGRHVPQTSGEPSQGLPAWIAADPSASLDNTDVVLWHTFGLTHFPSPEDYPVVRPHQILTPHQHPEDSLAC